MTKSAGDLSPTVVHFRRTGLLALEPSAFGLAFPVMVAAPEPFTLAAGGVAAVVDVCGPLTYDGFCADSYSAIRARFEAALASDAACVVVRYRSPGGEVSGAFDCARALPALAKAAGKPYIAFTESQCQSAAYALACGADRIVISDTAHVGSVGVISVAVETTKADAAMGLHFEIFASGERKADGNPHQTWTEEARRSAQAGIDASAQIFFELVRANRGIKAEPLQGASFMGEGAKALGLADAVASWDALMADIASGATQGTIASVSAAKELASMPFPDKKDDEKKDDKDAKAPWMKALRAAAEGGDEDAKKALSALDDKPADKAADDKPKDDAKAADEPDKDDEKPKDDKAKASADPLVASLLATVQSQGSQLAAIVKRDEDQARATFMATRPDLNAELVKALAGRPLAEVKAIVAAIPVAGNPLAPPTLTAPTPRGSQFAPSANAELDRRMGIVPTDSKIGVIETDQTQVFGVRVPADNGAHK